MSASYEEAFSHLVATVALAEGVPDHLVSHWPMIGRRWAGDLLVVGRALNGWRMPWSRVDAADLAKRERIVEEVRSDAEGGRACPLRWVTENANERGTYNTNRSAFWRVARRVSLAGVAVREREPSWSSFIAWSNLYKVAPAARGNPNRELRELQADTARELLAREIDELRPKRVLVLAGIGWFVPFAQHLGLSVSRRTGLVEGTASGRGALWVVAKHPMGKPEGRMISEILDAFNAGARVECRWRAEGMPSL